MRLRRAAQRIQIVAALQRRDQPATGMFTRDQQQLLGGRELATEERDFRRQALWKVTPGAVHPPPGPWAFRGGLGLFLVNNHGSFRNVVVEPLD